MADIPEEVREKLRAGGRKGGAAKVPKGYAMNRELASKAGRKSRKGKTNGKST